MNDKPQVGDRYRSKFNGNEYWACHVSPKGRIIHMMAKGQTSGWHFSISDVLLRSDYTLIGTEKEGKE